MLYKKHKKPSELTREQFGWYEYGWPLRTRLPCPPSPRLHLLILREGSAIWGQPLKISNTEEATRAFRCPRQSIHTLAETSGYGGLPPLRALSGATRGLSRMIQHVKKHNTEEHAPSDNSNSIIVKKSNSEIRASGLLRTDRRQTSCGHYWRHHASITNADIIAQLSSCGYHHADIIMHTSCQKQSPCKTSCRHNGRQSSSTLITQTESKRTAARLSVPLQRVGFRYTWRAGFSSGRNP